MMHTQTVLILLLYSIGDRLQNVYGVSKSDSDNVIDHELHPYHGGGGGVPLSWKTEFEEELEGEVTWEEEMREAIFKLEAEVAKLGLTSENGEFEEDIMEEDWTEDDEVSETLRASQEGLLNKLDFLEDEFEQVESEVNDDRSTGKKRRGKRTKQQNWMSKAIKKMSTGEAEGSCSAKGHGRSVRGIDCDKCTAWFVPYPCNCNCRGWTQITVDCWKPCSHYKDAYTQTVGLYCFKPCNRDNQLALTIGCGLVPGERTCHASSKDCAMKYVNHAISITEVLTTVLSGGVAGALKSAAKTALKAGTKVLLKKGLKAAFKVAARTFAKKLKSNKAIKRAVAKYKKKYKKAVKAEVYEQGATLFMAASMNSEPDWGKMADEIAETLDPTGVYSLVKGFIPKESCDDMVLMNEAIPGEESNLPDLDPIDLIDDENTRYYDTTKCTGCYVSPSTKGKGGTYGCHTGRGLDPKKCATGCAHYWGCYDHNCGRTVPKAHKYGDKCP